MEAQSTAVKLRFYWQRLRCAKRGERWGPRLIRSSQILQELAWLIVEARKHGVQMCVAEMARDRFAQQAAKVGGEHQIAAFVELGWIEAGPASVNSSAAHRAAEDEHHIGVAVIGTAIAVFARRASELRHGDDQRLLRQRTQINPECSYGLREVAQNVGELAFHGTFIHMVVPATDVGERNLYAEVRLNELCGLAQSVAEGSARVICARRRRVLLGIGGLQHFDRLEGLGGSAVKHGIYRLCVHCLEGVTQRGGGRIASSDAESVHVADCDGRRFARKNSWQRSAEGDRAERIRHRWRQS